MAKSDAKTPQNETDSAVDAKAFRAALGCFSTGVTVVTALARDGSPIGLTANSFSSVSLDPPLVLWSLSRQSPRYADYAAADHYLIHVLGEDQRALAEHFATPAQDKFASLDFSAGAGGAPLFDDVLAVFQCEDRHQYDGGDHVIFVGEVIEYSVSEQVPLIFSQGNFRSLRPSTNAPTGNDADSFVDNYFGYLLGKAGFEVNAGFNRQLKHHDVRPAVWRVLASLSDRTMTVNELARKALLKQPTLTKLADQMERDGLIAREIDPDDRRRVRLVISARGRRLAKKLITAARTHEAEVLSIFSDSERQSLQRSLEQLITHSGDRA